MRSVPDITKIVNDREIISTDAIMQKLSLHPNATYYKRDFLLRPGRWRGEKIYPLSLQPQRYFGKKVVLGHSDIPTLRRISRLFVILGAREVCGINVYPVGDKIYPIPLGITNDCDDSPVHRILGDTTHFLRADQSLAPRETFDGSIYVNFTSHNNAPVRQPILEMLSHHSNVTVRSPEMTDSGRVNFLSDLRKHSLVLCPEGNGIDTHRLWETLYMGGTPVVSQHPITNFLVKDLPVIQVKDWREVLDLKLMEERWEALQNSVFNFELLKAGEWVRRILKGREQIIPITDS